MAQEDIRYKVSAETKSFEQGMDRVQSRLRKTKGGVRRQSQAFTQLSYALDDAQYGFRGVQNNLQQIAVTAGLSGPVILGITGLTIAIGYLIENWDELTTSTTKATKALDEFYKNRGKAVFQRSKGYLRLE